MARPCSCSGGDDLSDYWSWSNAVDASGATIESSTGSAGDLVAGNLRDPRVGKPWRAGAMPVSLTVNLPATGGVAIIGLFGVNLASLASLSVAVYDGASLVWSDSVAHLEGRQAVFVRLDELGQLDPVNATRVVVSATGSVPIEIGRLWVGTADWTPRVGHVVNGSARRVIDLSNVARSPRSGARLADRGDRLRVFTAAYDALDQEEWDEVLYRIDVERGLAAQMLFVPSPDVYGLTRGPILGGLTELGETAFVGFLTAARSLTIQEDG